MGEWLELRLKGLRKTMRRHVGRTSRKAQPPYRTYRMNKATRDSIVRHCTVMSVSAAGSRGAEANERLRLVPDHCPFIEKCF